MLPQFRGRYIRTNETNAQPSQMIFFDTETLPREIAGSRYKRLHELRLWCATYVCMRKGKPTRRQEAQGKTSAEFFDWLDSKLEVRKPVWIFAHNLSFDATTIGLWNQLDAGRYVLEQSPQEQPLNKNGKPRKAWKGLVVTADPPTIIEMRLARSMCKLVWLDTLNWWRTKLSLIGESLGIPKMPMPDFEKPDEDWFPYCRNDVRIIEEAVIRWANFLLDNQLGCMKYTISGQAFAAYRHRFMTYAISTHLSNCTQQVETQAYYGGECRVLFCGKVVAPENWLGSNERQNGCYQQPAICGPITVVDVNSLYPYVMRGNLYPCKLAGFAAMTSMMNIQETLKRFAVVAKIRIDSPDVAYPVRKDGINMLARGKFVTSLAGPELQLAVDRGHVQSIGFIAWYEKEEIFTRFVDYFYNLKQWYTTYDKKELATQAKLMLNSLYGKFAQKVGRWKKCEDVYAPCDWGIFHDLDPVTGQAAVFRSLALHVQQEGNKEYAEHALVAISAYVTSYARVYMNDLITLAGEGNVLYMDTDSLHLTNAGLANLSEQVQGPAGDIGSLKIERQANEGEYRGVKYYRLNNSWTIAGVKPNADEVLPGIWVQDNFQGLDSILSKALPHGVMVEQVEINRSSEVFPGKVKPDGMVEGVVLNEW